MSCDEMPNDELAYCDSDGEVEPAIRVADPRTEVRIRRDSLRVVAAVPFLWECEAAFEKAVMGVVLCPKAKEVQLVTLAVVGSEARN